MWNLVDGSNPVLAVIYCVFIVFLGTFFMLNLILAVIMTAFTTINTEDLAEKVEK